MTGKVKLLFLMTRDFGELTNAVFFAQDAAFDSLLLLPPSLYEVQHEALPVPAAPYQSLADVLAAVERFRPDLVLFFSGYLHGHNRTLRNDDLATVVRGLRERGCRMVTSDPFLGLIARLDHTTFQWQSQVKEQLKERMAEKNLWVEDYKSSEHGLKKKLEQELGEAYAILKDVPHLYGVDPKGLAPTRSWYYSRAGMLRPPEARHCPAEVVRALGLDPARPHWLFILAGEDYQPAVEFDGVPFNDLLTDQLYETLNQGRQPVLVGPRACLEAVTLRSSPGDGLVLVPYCRHDWFLSLALDAEYAFYWNYFSNSSLLRTMNRLPVFFFDRGHMARFSAQLFDRYMQCYYVAGCPPCLPFTEPLDAGALRSHAAGQERAMNGMADHLLKAPSPAEVVRQVTGQPV